MSNKPRILIISYTDLDKAPRVYRQVKHLLQYYHITTLGTHPIKLEAVEFIPIKHRNISLPRKIINAIRYKLHIYKPLEWEYFHYEPVLAAFKEKTFDLIISHDLNTLPLVFRLWPQSVPVVCDLHEYLPQQFAHQFKWRFLFQGFTLHLCRNYLTRCSHSFAVSQGIVDEYNKVFGVRPGLLTNASNFQDLQPVSTNPGNIRLIHHGAAHPSRKIHRMIEVMKYADPRFSLFLMLVPGDPVYIEKLKTISAGMDNVHFIPGVPMTEIPAALNQFDIGIYFLEPLNFNYLHALPNKIFEFIQGRLSLLVGPTPGMATIVNREKCGMVVDSFEPREIAKQLNQLTADQIDAHKQNSHQAAAHLNAQKNMELLEETVKRLINN